MINKEQDNRILIISDIGAAPPYRGNRIRMRSLLKEIRRLGYQIHFAGISLSETERNAVIPYIDEWITNFSVPNRSFWEKIGFSLNGVRQCNNNPDESKANIDRYFHESWIEKARKIQEEANYKRVFVPYVFNSRFLEVFKKAKLKIIDTHDIFSQRDKKLKSQGISEMWFSTNREEEKRGLQRANRIIAIQKNEERYFSGLLNDGIQVQTVRHFVNKNFLDIYSSVESQKTIGFLGSENPINIHGLQWFLSDVFPDLKKLFPDLVLLIGGTVCSKLQQNEQYVLFGQVQDPKDFYHKCICTINPIQAGTGLKIKTIESLSYGRPVISTITGADGLEEFINNGISLVKGKDEFISAISSLLKSPEDIPTFMKRCDLLIDEMNRQSRRNLKKLLNDGSSL